jgi:hypothetical protein
MPLVRKLVSYLARNPRQDDLSGYLAGRHGPTARLFKERKRAMRILGYATAISLALGGAALTALTIKAVPDIQRYLKMRSI